MTAGAAAQPQPPCDIRLRPVLTSDLPALAAIHAASFADEPWDAGQLAEVLAGPGAAGLLAEAAAGPLAFLVWRRLLDEAEILTLAVAPAARRRGLGAALLQALLARLLAAGGGRLLLEVGADNPAAAALYAAAGFRQVGRRAKYYRRGCDALLLQLIVPPATAPEDATK